MEKPQSGGSEDSGLLFASAAEACAFAEGLRTREIGKRLDYRQRTGSTNDLALEAARAGAPHGQVFVADVQDAGRGRRGRRWECAAGVGLLFSVVVRPAEELGWIPLAAGLACVEGIGEVCGLHLTVKWPNDVVLPCAAAPGWRKLGGILCESALPAPGAESGRHVVIGIGLNINHGAHALPRRAKAPATSVYLETGALCDRKEILRAILERLEQHLAELRGPGGRAALRARVEEELRRWWTPGRGLRIQMANGEESNGKTVAGSFAGLDELGRLRIRDQAGREVLLADAEIVSAGR